MTITRNIKIVFCLLMFPFCCAMAQEEYTWEMGGVIGGSFYMGDANSSTPFKDTGIAGGFIARYLLSATEWEHEQAKYYLYISCNSHTVFLLLLNYIRKRKFDYFIIVA